MKLFHMNKTNPYQIAYKTVPIHIYHKIKSFLGNRYRSLTDVRHRREERATVLIFCSYL